MIHVQYWIKLQFLGPHPPTHFGGFSSNWLKAMLQESHWAYTSEWLTKDFYCFHSGVPGRQAGLLCLINRGLCHANQISWRVLHPGRMVHIRIHGATHHIDLVNLYQHVGTHSRLDEREQIWRELDSFLDKASKRNT